MAIYQLVVSRAYVQGEKVLVKAGSLNQWVLLLPVVPIKHGSLKEKWQWWAGNTGGSPAAVNDFSRWVFFQILPAHRCNFLKKLTIKWAAFKIGSLETVAVAKPWVSSPDLKLLHLFLILLSLPKTLSSVLRFSAIYFKIWLQWSGRLTIYAGL